MHQERVMSKASEKKQRKNKQNEHLQAEKVKANHTQFL